MADPEGIKPFVLDFGSLLSLGIAFSLMPAAQILSTFLPATTPRIFRFLFLWHAFDFLTHSIIEGSFLYHSFRTFIQLPATTDDFPHPAVPRDAIPYLYGRADRRYGPSYGDSVTARMWQEYAKADRRWGGADLNVISLEILTVGLAGPAAAYICYLIYKAANIPPGKEKSSVQAKIWFAAAMLATGELYGGFMTFAPEWLSGNTQLKTDDPVYLWLYLVFFNLLWVLIPLWVLCAAYREIMKNFERAGSMTGWKKAK